MRKLLMLFILAPLCVLGQSGVKFEKYISLQEAKEKAKASNKYVFIDAYATWCVPCQMMDKNTFPDAEVGAFMNEHFVNTKFQLDKTEKDAEEIKNLYPDGEFIMKEYNLQAYPSYFILSPSGELVHKFVGYHEPKPFLELLKMSVDPAQQIVALQRKMEANALNLEELKALIKVAQQTGNDDVAKSAFEKVLPQLSDAQLMEKDNLNALISFAGAPGEKGFQILTEKSAEVDAVMGNGFASRQIANAILATEIYPKINPNEPEKLDEFNAFVEEKIKEYAKYDIEKEVRIFQTQVFAHFKKWDDYGKTVKHILSKYKGSLQDAQINSLGWTIFENIDDPLIIRAVLAPLKEVVERDGDPQPMIIDTYANLLHKNGQTKEAIRWQEKALSHVDEASKAQYEEVLNKMKRGEKTW